MAKLITSDVTDGQGMATTVNANNDLIEDAVENQLSRDGASPNQMEAELDMNSNAINNLPDAVNLQSPVTLAQQLASEAGGSSLTQEAISLLLNPQTVDEAAAAVVPTLYNYNEYDPLRYGATHDVDKTTSGTDNSSAIEDAVSVGLQEIPVRFTGQVGDVELTSSMNGYNKGVILAKQGSASVFTLINDPDAWTLWHHLEFSNMYLDLLGSDPGGTFARTINGFQYPLTPSSSDKTLAGRNVWRNVVINRADKALYQPTGNFGNYLYNCQLLNGNYGVFGVESNTPQVMHPGMLYMNGGEVSGNRKAGIYINNPTENLNGTYLQQVSVEGNIGHGIYFDGMNLCPDGPILESVHFEGNDSDGDGTIDLGFGKGVETIRDLMCHDVDHIQINKCTVGDSGMEFNNSMALLDGCFMNSSSIMAKDADSVVRCVNANLDGCGANYAGMIESLTQQRRATGDTGVTMRANIPHRDNIVYQLPGSGVGLYGETFADAAINMSGGTGVRTGREGPTAGAGQPLFKHFNRMSTSVDTQYYSDLITLTNGKWYVYSTCLKFETAAPELVEFTNSTFRLCVGLGDVYDNNLTPGEWHTTGGVAEYTGTTGDCRFRVTTEAASAPFIGFGATQIIEFDTQQEAIDYFNSKAFWVENIYEYNGATNTGGSGAIAVDFTTEGFVDQPDTNYNIMISGDSVGGYYVTSITATGFTIRGGTNDEVQWNVTRRDE